MNHNLSTTESISNLLYILLLHTLFFSISFYLINNYSLFISIPIFIVISLIHHKFLGEFIHEGCHYHLFKSKKINEFLSNCEYSKIFSGSFDKSNFWYIKALPSDKGKSL